MSKISLLKRLFILGLMLAGCYVLLITFTPDNPVTSIAAEQPCTDDITSSRFGFNPDSVFIEESILQPNQFLGEILAQAGVAYTWIDQLARKAEDVFSVKQLRHGKSIALVRSDACSPASYFIYEPDPYRYVLFRLEDSVDVRIIERDIDVSVETASGVIESSLWVAMESEGHQWELISKMEDALAWSVDFHHIKKGDAYKLVYEKQYVDGEPVGIGKLLGAWFRSGKTSYYSVYYENKQYAGFYDPEGVPMKKAFLKAPVKYSRISSRYNTRRFHPVLKVYRGHFGTDYAAGYGTPIVAVADGTISKASYTRGNGNFVKIRHDKVYETQYLHMQRFAKGIKPGVRVKQGQTIGYVGATGLATGPHVCFRFWKNGRQVDHLRENLPPPDPLPAGQLPDYLAMSKSVIAQLDAIPEMQLETGDPCEEPAGPVSAP